MEMAYFDNAATTFPKPEEVYQYMDSFYRNYGVNIGRGSYDTAITASSVMEDTRNLLLELFHAQGKKVLFQPTATEALNLVLRGLPWHDGMVVYVTPFEHNAVTRTLNYIQKDYKLHIIELAVDRNTLSYQLEKIAYQFQDAQPSVVIASHASNVCGVIAPIERIFPLAKKYSAVTVADMSQTAGLVDVDLIAAQVDYAVFAGHKTLYGPFGASGVIAPPNVDLLPLVFGGTGIESANPLMPDILPEKYEAGSHNVQAIAGLYAALKWSKNTGISAIRERESKARERLLNILSDYPFIHTIKGEAATVGVVSCTFDGYSSDSIGQVLNEQGIACRVGLHCAPTAHRFLGTFPAGTVRFSVGYFTTEKDFEKLQAALDYIEENI